MREHTIGRLGAIYKPSIERHHHAVAVGIVDGMKVVFGVFNESEVGRVRAKAVAKRAVAQLGGGSTVSLAEGEKYLRRLDRDAYLQVTHGVGGNTHGANSNGGVVWMD